MLVGPTCTAVQQARGWRQLVASLHYSLPALHHPGALGSSFLPSAAALQSYGIKVGYGVGGANPQTVKPGEAEAKKASSCC
jgi:hypothetical protein